MSGSTPKRCRCESVDAGAVARGARPLELANTYADNEDLNQLVIDAICMRLSAGIEVLARLDSPVRSGLFGDSWQLMWGMRNRVSLTATSSWTPTSCVKQSRSTCQTSFA